MAIVYLLLLVAAFVMFVLAAINVPVRFNLVALGLALWVAVPLLQILLSLTP
jgi:hypothetical protein